MAMASKTDPTASQTRPDFAELSIAIVGGLALALIAIFLCVVPLTGKTASGRDFVVYWATAGLRRVRWSAGALKDERRTA